MWRGKGFEAASLQHADKTAEWESGAFNRRHNPRHYGANKQTYNMNKAQNAYGNKKVADESLKTYNKRFRTAVINNVLKECSKNNYFGYLKEPDEQSAYSIYISEIMSIIEKEVNSQYDKMYNASKEPPNPGLQPDFYDSIANEIYAIIERKRKNNR